MFTFPKTACQAARFDATPNLTGPLYGVLTPQFDKLTKILARTEKHDRWLKLEAPSRLLTACVLAQELKSVVTVRASAALRSHLVSDETTGQWALDGWRLFSLAMAKLADSGQAPGEEKTVVPRCLAAVEATKGAEPLVNALAKLSLGRYHRMAGNKALAAACYRQVLALPPRGIHMFQAIADQEFKTML